MERNSPLDLVNGFGMQVISSGLFEGSIEAASLGRIADVYLNLESFIVFRL